MVLLPALHWADIRCLTMLMKSGEQNVKCEERIYCIEGIHNWGDKHVEPTVEPMLELLRRMGAWDYLHRSCSTEAELIYRLGTEWNGYCKKGSVLYFSTHGESDQIWLSDDKEGVVGLLNLKEYLGEKSCSGRHIHFGGCVTFSKGEYNLRDLMEYTGATSVSGYATDSNWLEWNAPAILLELQLFWHLKSVNLNFDNKGRQKKLECIYAKISERFQDCEFNMLVRQHKSKETIWLGTT